MKRYLLFVSLTYSYPILRPIQNEIRKRGGEVAWYIEDSCPVRLLEGEKQLKTTKEVMEYNPIAIFAPGNYIYDFFPGIKVEVFHGLYYKRTDYGDHYKIRGLFDLYCTTSSMFTPHFKELEAKYGFFRVKETGWSKFDDWMPDSAYIRKNTKPTIVYAPTFTKSLCSAYDLYDKIEELIKTKDWQWVFSFHPLMDKENIDKYRALADKYGNASFSEADDKLMLFRDSDVMLSDTSSVIYEYLWLNKPAVTYKNTFPSDHLINIENPAELEAAIGEALSNPELLMEKIRLFMDKVHPFRDAKSSGRILDAVDNFIEKDNGKIKRKPFNLFRKLKMRKKAGYFPFGPYYNSK